MRELELDTQRPYLVDPQIPSVPDLDRAADRDGRRAHGWRGLPNATAGGQRPADRADGSAHQALSPGARTTEVRCDIHLRPHYPCHSGTSTGTSSPAAPST